MPQDTKEQASETHDTRRQIMWINLDYATVATAMALLMESGHPAKRGRTNSVATFARSDKKSAIFVLGLTPLRRSSRIQSVSLMEPNMSSTLSISESQFRFHPVSTFSGFRLGELALHLFSRPDD
jgi:hypothetical protein